MNASFLGGVCEDDAVKRVEESLRAGDHDIRVGRASRHHSIILIIAHTHVNLAQRVNARRHRLHNVLLQLHVNRKPRVHQQLMHRLERRVHWPRANRRAHFRVAARQRHRHRRAWQHTIASNHLHAFQAHAAFTPRHVLELIAHNTLQIEVRDVLLLVRQLLELDKRAVQLVLVNLAVPELLETRPKRVPPRVLSKHERVLVQPNRARVHDFVREAVLQNAVLMNPTLVCKRVRAHNRLVRLHQHARQVGHHPR
mmetsp:Transcript_1994/g.4396  ORF Transcript_1994/g.4396 Transcript_1994/m.4396 type:complete len:254 (+) Transcript_1994:399-1160(+)